MFMMCSLRFQLNNYRQLTNKLNAGGKTLYWYRICHETVWTFDSFRCRPGSIISCHFCHGSSQVLAVIMLLGLYKFATKADKPHRDSMMTVTGR